VTLSSGFAVRSSIALTTIEFTSPSFFGAGEANVELWVVGREAVTLQQTVTYFDASVATLGFVYPAWGYAGEELVLQGWRNSR
jgi:hypothetical protein